ncbi:glycosyltransferase family 9 protein [Terriglobus tenax]|uniref:glycosyltransferase family 9 protein n=1 Tax=Terriglobus tenax TaxID=1111115 RepID=UPI0021E01D91|nr:glycosyltransferase family 9 protein [Terriglobus tenax]
MTPNHDVKRVLVYRLGSLGDTLVALPSLRLIARAFPNAERRMLTNWPVSSKAPAAAAVLGPTGLIHEYMRYTVGTRSPLALAKLAWEIRRYNPDVLVYLAAGRGVKNARRDAAFFRVAGVKTIVGLPLTEDMQRNRLDENGIYEPEAAKLARNIDALGDARLDEAGSWELELVPAEIDKAGALMEALGDRKVIAVSVGTKVQAKDWGPENWRGLMAQMGAAYPGYGLALAGAPEESAVSEAAADGWRAAGGGPVVNLCGKLTPRESAAAFARAEVFVGHDSGPMHLAAAVQTPCVAIFAARNKPAVWFPYGPGHRVVYHKVDCWGCGLETCIVEKKKCLMSITVDEVMNEVRAALA